MPPTYRGHEFEAIKARYEDQVQLLRSLTGIDLRIVTGFITVHLQHNPIGGRLRPCNVHCYSGAGGSQSTRCQ